MIPPTNYTASDLISICNEINKRTNENGTKPDKEDKYEVGKGVMSLYEKIDESLRKKPTMSKELIHNVLGIHENEIVESSSNSVKTNYGLDFFIVRDNLYVADLKTKKFYILSEKESILDFCESCMGSTFSE